MATFRIEVAAYNIISCAPTESTLETIATTLNIDTAGNGSLELFAYDTEGAIKFAKHFIEIYRKRDS